MCFNATSRCLRGTFQELCETCALKPFVDLFFVIYILIQMYQFGWNKILHLKLNQSTFILASQNHNQRRLKALCGSGQEKKIPCWKKSRADPDYRGQSSVFGQMWKRMTCFGNNFFPTTLQPKAGGGDNQTTKCHPRVLNLAVLPLTAFTASLSQSLRQPWAPHLTSAWFCGTIRNPVEKLIQGLHR